MKIAYQAIGGALLGVIAAGLFLWFMVKVAERCT